MCMLTVIEVSYEKVVPTHVMMDLLKINTKETFQLKPCLFHPSKYSASTKWSKSLLLKFPCVSVHGTKPSGSAAVNTCRNYHVSSSLVSPLDKKSTSLSYTVYQKLRSYLRTPVVLAETKKEIVSKDEATTETKKEVSSEDAETTEAKKEVLNEDEGINTENIPVVSKEEVMVYIANETGRDRLKDLFAINPQGGHHPDLVELWTDFYLVAILGMTFGFAAGARTTSIDFREANRATTFRSAMNYQRMKIDKSLIGGMKYAVKAGLFLGTFVTMIMGISKCVAVYRNKTSFVDYSIAATVTGALFRIHLGLRGVVAGGVVGLALGTIAGLPMMGAAYALGATEDVRHYKYIEEKLAIKKKSTGETGPLALVAD